MKRTEIGILMAVFVAAAAIGCGKTENKPQDVQTAVSSVSDRTEDAVSEVTEAVSSVSVVEESEEIVATSESGEEAEQEEKTPAGRYEISIPEGQKLTGQYDTIEGLNPEPGTYIAVVAKDLSSGYWKAVKAGAEQAITDLNTALSYSGDDKIRMTFEGPSEEGGIDAQINTIDSVISDCPDALCLGIIDIQSCSAQIELAGENGIPVIITDSGVDNDAIVSRITIDNKEAGREAARRLAEMMNGTGQILIIAHQMSAQTSIDRVAGFTEEIQKQSGILVAETISGDGEDSLESQLIAAMEKYPGISGVFCTNENMSVDFLKLLPGLTFVQPVSMIGFDSGEVQRKAIDDGTEAGLISQNPYAVGYATIVAAIRAATDLEPDAMVNTGFVYLDAETIHLDENQKYLY